MFIIPATVFSKNFLLINMKNSGIYGMPVIKFRMWLSQNISTLNDSQEILNASIFHVISFLWFYLLE